VGWVRLSFHTWDFSCANWWRKY